MAADDLLRLSIGLEAEADLIADLEKGPGGGRPAPAGDCIMTRSGRNMSWRPLPNQEIAGGEAS